MTPYYVYILQCSDDTLYVGITNNLLKRLLQHNTSKRGAHYTKIRRPVVLQYSEVHNTIGDALRREREIKKWKRSEKILLINTKKINKIKNISKKVSTKIFSKTKRSKKKIKK